MYVCMYVGSTVSSPSINSIRFDGISLLPVLTQVHPYIVNHPTYIHTYIHTHAYIIIQATTISDPESVYGHHSSSTKTLPGGWHIHTYIHTFIHTYIHTYIHTEPVTSDPCDITHTYIHTYIHSSIHTYIPNFNFFFSEKEIKMRYFTESNGLSHPIGLGFNGTYIHTYIQTYRHHIHTSIDAYKHYMHTYTHYTYIHYIHTCTYTHYTTYYTYTTTHTIHTCIHTLHYILLYIHTYIHTYIHKYIHSWTTFITF
jgi:hypothetical protein